MTPPFLLDTDVLSNLRQRRPHPALAQWLLSVDPDNLFTSVTSIAEIQRGICVVADLARASQMQAWLDGMLRDGQPTVVDLNVQAALVLGRMWAAPPLRVFIANDPRSRKVRSGADLAIAACAIARGMILASRNISDFLQIHGYFPLPGLFNPFDSSWAVQP